MSMSLSVFTADGEVHVILPEDEQELAEATSRAKLLTYKPSLLDKVSNLSTQLRAPLAELGRRLHLSNSKIGIRMNLTLQPEPYVVSTNFHGSLTALISSVLPQTKLLGCDDLLENQKAVKTSSELAHILQSVRLASRGFNAAEACIQPRLIEPQVASIARSAFDCAFESDSIQRSYGSFYCMSGPNSAKAGVAYARTRRRELLDGDLVMIHANTCADGYWTDITRTYSVGEPSGRHQEIRSAIKEARHAALDAIKPGIAAREVDRAARSVMSAHGFGDAFQHATGHGVGYAAANANGLPRIHPCSPDTLQEGMTFNIEPAAYFDGYGGMRHCDVVAVTETGYKVLSDF
ncbi:MAG: Xaa-Pro peptidase family protein [Acidobacteriaceae bacterium]